MLWCSSTRSIRHGHVIHHEPTSICGYRRITSAAAERRQERRRRGILSHTPKGNVAASQDSATLISGKSTQRPTGHISDIKFDPFPPMILTARPLYSRTAKAQVNDARRRNIERGRSLISRYGSAELASKALNAAFSHLRSQARRNRAMRKLSRWKLDNLHELWRDANCGPGLQLSLAQQVVGVREAALEHATGFDEVRSSSALQRDSMRVSQLEFMYPFDLQLVVQDVLYRFLRISRIKSIQEFGRQGMILHDEQMTLVQMLARWKATQIEHSGKFGRRYESIKRSTYDNLANLSATHTSLWLQCVGFLDFVKGTSKTQSMNGRSIESHFRRFISALVSARRLISDTEVSLLVIQLRRQSLIYGGRQNIYNALHHHFKYVRSLSQHLYRQITRQYSGLAMQATKFNRRTRSEKAKPSLLKHERAFFEALARAEFGMQEIVRLYHDEFLPLWASRIQHMSSWELTRQNRVAQNYWLSCFRSNKQYKLRLAELESIYEQVSLARRLCRPGTRIIARSQHYHKMALEAIARLSALYQAQYQETAKSPAQASRAVPPNNGATISVSKPAVPDVRKAVLWQPNRRSTDEDLPGKSAISSSSQQLSRTKSSSKGDRRSNTEVISLDGRCASALVQFQSEQPAPTVALRVWGKQYTAERLLARYKTVDLALEAVYARHEVVKRYEWDMKSHLQTNMWRNAVRLAELQARRPDTMLVFFQQKLYLYKAAHDNAGDMTKPLALGPLLGTMSHVSIMRQMRPFEDQVGFLQWLYLILVFSPYSRLRSFLPLIQAARYDMELLVDNLYRIRRILDCPSDYERRYEATKRICTEPCAGLILASRALLNLNNAYLDSLKGCKLRLRTPTIKANVALKMFQWDVIQAAMDLIVIGMRRNGSTGNRQQNVFNSVYHHVKELRRSTRGLVGFVQHMYRDLARSAIRQKEFMGSWPPILAHEAAVVSNLRDLDSFNQSMADIFYHKFSPLWHRHLEIMSPTELNRHDKVAQNYWLTQLKSQTTTESKVRLLELKGLERTLSSAHGSYTRTRELTQGRTAIMRWRKFNLAQQEIAVKAMERLEQIFPSRWPKSAQAIRTILGIDKKPTPKTRVASAKLQAPQARLDQKIRDLHQNNAGIQSKKDIAPSPASPQGYIREEQTGSTSS